MHRGCNSSTRSNKLLRPLHEGALLNLREIWESSTLIWFCEAARVAAEAAQAAEAKKAAAAEAAARAAAAPPPKPVTCADPPKAKPHQSSPDSSHVPAVPDAAVPKSRGITIPPPPPPKGPSPDASRQMPDASSQMLDAGAAEGGKAKAPPVEATENWGEADWSRWGSHWHWGGQSSQSQWTGGHMTRDNRVSPYQSPNWAPDPQDGVWRFDQGARHGDSAAAKNLRSSQ